MAHVETVDEETEIERQRRMNASVSILKTHEGHRRIEVDGQVLPTYTDGPIVVEYQHLGSYKEGGYWPATPDDEWDPLGGQCVKTLVHLTLCLIDGELDYNPDMVKEVHHTSLSPQSPTMEG